MGTPIENKTIQSPEKNLDITQKDGMKEFIENEEESSSQKQILLETEEVRKKSLEVSQKTSETETEIKDTQVELEYQSDQTLQTKPSSLENSEKDESPVEKKQTEKSESKEDSTENDKLSSAESGIASQKEEKVDNQNENTTQPIDPSETGEKIEASNTSVNIESKTEITVTERKESFSSTVERETEIISVQKYEEISTSLDENEVETIKQLEETSNVKECETLNQEAELKDRSASEDRSQMGSQPSNNEIMDESKSTEDKEEVNIPESGNTTSVDSESLKNKPGQDQTEAFDAVAESTEVTDKKIEDVADDNENGTIDHDENSSGNTGVKELKNYLEKDGEDNFSKEANEEMKEKIPNSELPSKNDQNDVQEEEEKKVLSENDDTIELIGEIKDDQVVKTESSTKDLDDTQIQDVEESSSEEKVTKQLQGQLKIYIFKALNLEKDALGKSDPYVVVKYKDTVLQSNCIKNSLQPEWNFDASFDLLGDQDIEITVRDSDIGRDNVLGNITVPAEEMISYEEKTWLDLQNCKSGKILVSSEYKEQESEEEEDTEEADNIQSVDEKPLADDVETNIKEEEKQKKKNPRAL